MERDDSATRVSQSSVEFQMDRRGVPEGAFLFFGDLIGVGSNPRFAAPGVVIGGGTSRYGKLGVKGRPI